MSELIEKAKKFALEKHAGQMYGDKPYSYHLQGVVDNLNGSSTSTIASAWLHDVIEDTKATQSELLELFNPNIVYIVNHLSKSSGSYTDYIIGIRKYGVIDVIDIKIADLKFNIKKSESRKLNGYEKQRLEKYKLALYILEN